MLDEGVLKRLINKVPPRFRVALGWFLVITGAILGPVPVIQGWIFGIPGLIILAEHYHWARRVLKWAKKKAKWQEKPYAEHPGGNERRREVAGDQ